MAYKNFIFRSLISLVFIISYFYISIFNFEYIFYLIALIYLLIMIEVLLYFKKYNYYIIFYLLISFISFLNIDFDSQFLLIFNLMIITIISFDIFSYFCGVTLGKIKLFKKISPNKTLEGLIGGIIFSILISIFYLYYSEIKIKFYKFFFILLIILTSLFGDLIESIFKRLNNLKNSSNLLPGHGGFFDRFDSFVLSIITYSFLYNLIWK